MRLKTALLALCLLVCITLPAPDSPLSGKVEAVPVRPFTKR